MRIDLHGFDGCPGLAPVRALLNDVLLALRVDDPVNEVLVESDDDARCRGFMGSPSVLIDGLDVAGRVAPVDSLCCRVYESGPVPARWMLEAGVLRALQPRGVLFLCVANSARSQMAEGIGRCLVGSRTEIFSAGSAPSRVHPLAIAALAELGNDIGAQRSKGVAEIPVDRVDAVVTLCGEEICPVWLADVRRVHWGLPDPAIDGGEGIQAFRTVRDELVKRLELLFGMVA